MNQTLLIIIGTLCYSAAALLQILFLMDKIKSPRWLLFGLGILAVIIHAYLLHHWIDVSHAQNLTLFNVLSMVVWLVAVLILLITLGMPIENLSIFIFPLAALSMLLVWLFPSSHLLNTGSNPKSLIHILLSILALSLLCIAAFQAILLAIQDKRLHDHPSKMIRVLPPLQTMETLLFRMIAIGFIVLSVVIMTAILFFQHALTPPLLQKTALSILSWCVYAVLLGGRYCFGWRGKVAIRWTLLGFTLLLLTYVASRWLW